MRIFLLTNESWSLKNNTLIDLLLNFFNNFFHDRCAIIIVNLFITTFSSQGLMLNIIGTIGGPKVGYLQWFEVSFSRCSRVTQQREVFLTWRDTTSCMDLYYLQKCKNNFISKLISNETKITFQTIKPWEFVQITVTVFENQPERQSSHQLKLMWRLIICKSKQLQWLWTRRVFFIHIHHVHFALVASQDKKK